MRSLALALVLAACSAAPADPPLPPPSAQRAAAPTTRLAPPAARDRDCADFARRSEAQAALRPADPDRLDADRDGSACERLRR